jgi:hypothetical protein
LEILFPIAAGHATGIASFSKFEGNSIRPYDGGQQVVPGDSGMSKEPHGIKDIL